MIPSHSMNPSAQIDQLIAGLADWRGATLAAIRETFLAADPLIVEEWKWMVTPTWSFSGTIAVANAHWEKVKILFSCGARLADPEKLFNAGLDGNAWLAIDHVEGDATDAPALKRLVQAAIAYNQSKPRKVGASRTRKASEA